MYSTSPRHITTSRHVTTASNNNNPTAKLQFNSNSITCTPTRGRSLCTMHRVKPHINLLRYLTLPIHGMHITPQLIQI